MKFVHAADLHLDSPMRGLDRYEGAPHAEMRRATRRALENLVALCLDERAALLVIAGDLYDGSWRDYSTGLFFIQQMTRLRDANIPVFLIRGNHDAMSQITKSLRLPENVREFSAARPETVELSAIGVAVHGQSFATRAVTDDLAAAYPPATPGLFNIGVLHTSMDGREGHAAYAPTKLATLVQKGYDYWALGHVHAREVVCEDPWVVFPGNLQGRHARETGAKGATLVTVEHGHVVAVEPRALDVVRWAELRVDLARARTLEDAVDDVRRSLAGAVTAAEGRPLAARVVLTGRTAAHGALEAEGDKLRSELQNAANDVAGEAWLEKIVLRTEAMLDLEALRAQDGAIGQLARAAARTSQDDAAMLATLAELEPLIAKLPAELRDGLDAVVPTDASDFERRRALFEEVEQLLLGRLVGPRAAAVPRLQVARES